MIIIDFLNYLDFRCVCPPLWRTVDRWRWKREGYETRFPQSGTLPCWTFQCRIWNQRSTGGGEGKLCWRRSHCLHWGGHYGGLQFHHHHHHNLRRHHHHHYHHALCHPRHPHHHPHRPHQHRRSHHHIRIIIVTLITTITIITLCN